MKTLITLITTVALMAAVEGRAAPPDDYDAIFTVYVNGSESWTPFPGKSGVSFSNSNNNALAVRDNSTKVDFTGKQVGESVITATLDGTAKKALVRVRATDIGEADKPEKPGDESGTVIAEKYITYNKPVKSYYIEYTEDEKSKFEAYEDKKYCYSFENYYKYVGSEEIDYTWTGNNRWYKHTGDPVYIGSWLSEEYKEHEYPLGNFAAYVSNYKGTSIFYKYGLSLTDVAASDNLEMPNHTDVTKFYIRSEKVINIMCDVYKDSQTASGGTETWTWWVDPRTGFTLKYELIDRYGDKESYEVTKLVVGKPDWDGKHLHPKEGDTFINVD